MNTKSLEKFEVLSSEMLASVEGGVGYRWHCSDGTVSAWHMFRHTAQENANNHIAIYGGVCRVYND